METFEGVSGKFWIKFMKIISKILRKVYKNFKKIKEFLTNFLKNCKKILVNNK